MPQSDYRLDIYDDSGVIQATLTGSGAADVDGEKAGYVGLAYTVKVNHPGFVIFDLKGDHELLLSLSDKWQVEVWRKPSGQSWARQMSGIYREPTWAWQQFPTFRAYCPGVMDMLNWRIVNWASGTADRAAFTSEKAETIMKTLVDYNAVTALATTGNGRKRDGVIAGLTTEADGTNGNTINWYCAQDNLLKTLQDLARIAGGDFDLVKTSATAYEFRWYTGQLGTDRSATVTFAMERGNMANPTYKETRLKEKTAACVFGQGQGSDRDYVTRTGTNYDVGDNNIELDVDARNVDFGDTSGLNARGDLKLDEAEARSEFKFDVLQAPATLYGVHYFLGDLVTAINPFTGASYTLKVDQVTVDFNHMQTGEDITVDMVQA